MILTIKSKYGDQNFDFVLHGWLVIVTVMFLNLWNIKTIDVTNLTSMDLRQNHIREVGVQTLANFLCDNHTLTSLDLGQNQIGVIGIAVLIEALSDNHHLITLNLGCNQIDDVCVQTIAKWLQTITPWPHWIFATDGSIHGQKLRCDTAHVCQLEQLPR